MLSILTLIIACTSDKSTDSTGEELTWTKDIQPIVEQHCVRCHQEGGQGTGDFTDYDTVKAMLPLMLSSIDSGRMPPPAADPDCHDYQDSDKFILPPESRSMLEEWMNNETPYGDESDAQVYDRSMSKLENANLTLTITEPYTPTFASTDNARNEYRCFALEHNQTEPFYIKALHPIVDNEAMVHHVVLAKANDNGVIPGATNVDGVDCIEDGAFVTGNYQDGAMLGGWAPGMSPVRFPENAGLLVKPNEKIVIQMHYYQSAELADNASDQSGYSFEITNEAPEHVVTMFPLGIHDFTIPAGDESYSVREDFELPIGINIWGVFPHMHVLGKAYEMSTEDECLIASDNYDFDNQLTYMYKEPILLEANTKFSMSCTWDNSVDNPNLVISPPVDIGYGERTDEEMCYAFTLASIAR
jgi:hypothetical protein